MLEMEEKKKGDINLAEGRPACLSLCQPLSQDTHAHTHTDTCALPSSTLFVSLVRAAAPHQVKNSQE